MSPMTSTAALRARPTDQCGAGWVSGTPGVSTSAAILDQSIARKSAVAMPSAAASATLLRIVIEGDDIGAAGRERAAGGKPRAAEPEHRDPLAGEGGDGNHELARVTAI